MTDGPSVPDAPDEVRPTPVADRRLLDTINAQLAGIPDKSITAAVMQIPDGRVLRGAVFVNVGHGLSFVGWLDHTLDYKPGFGWGLAIRKTFGSRSTRAAEEI